ncbi:MAG: hypothetical protein ACE5DQ_00135, partial [Candidatus Paceibacterota bacterium]
DLKRPRIQTLVRRRYERFRNLGNFFDSPSEYIKAKTPKTAAKSRTVSRVRSALSPSRRSATT